MIDHHCVGAALGLGAFARVVDHERVEERHVTERGVGPAACRQGERLAGEPFEGAVLAEVHDRVGTPHLVEPAVERQVVMGWRQVR